MKICLLTRRFALGSGGIGRVSIELRDKLGALGHKVYPISTTKESLPAYFKYAFLDNAINIPSGQDIYHAVTPMESIWIPKDKGVATILDIIPIIHPEMQGARMGGDRLKYAVGKTCFTIGCKMAARCQRIVCISEQVRQDFIEHFDVDERKVSVVRLGIREDLRPRGEESRKRFRIGYLGQLDRRKRVDLLVREFVGSDFDGELVLGGKGVDEPLLRKLSNGDNRVKFAGYIPDDKLNEFYNSLDVMVFPSMIEGYGLPPVEAMACKIPVVVLADAIIPWEVKSRCIVVEEFGTLFNREEYLIGLMEYIDYEGNYQFAKEHNWDKCVQEYIKLYEEVVGL